MSFLGAPELEKMKVVVGGHEHYDKSREPVNSMGTCVDKCWVLCACSSVATYVAPHSEAHPYVLQHEFKGFYLQEL